MEEEPEGVGQADRKTNEGNKVQRQLHVQIQSASNLQDMNKMFGLTPYVKVRLEPPGVSDDWQRTDTVDGDTQPSWQSSNRAHLVIPLGFEEIERSVVLQVWDENIVSDDLIGTNRSQTKVSKRS
jgi:hypothetical protein